VYGVFCVTHLSVGWGLWQVARPAKRTAEADGQNSWRVPLQSLPEGRRAILVEYNRFVRFPGAEGPPADFAVEECSLVPKPPEEVLEFLCPKCSKKLKAGPAFAGRRVKCPSCSQPVNVPDVPLQDGQTNSVKAKQVPASPTAGPIAGPPLIERKQPAPAEDLWLSLDVPAIDNAQARETAAADAKAKKAAAQTMKNRVRNESSPDDAIATPPIPRSRRQASEAALAATDSPVSGGFDDEEFSLAPVDSNPKRAATKPAATPAEVGKPSLFDDDLPELAELEQVPTSKVSTSYGLDDLGDLDALIPTPVQNDAFLDEAMNSPPPLPNLLQPDTTDHEYRILCKTCGTPQYVRLSARGMKIKCPDCFSSFKVPDPPADWSPKKKSKLQATGEEMPLQQASQERQAEETRARRDKTSAMLAKAEQEISDGDLEKLYDMDFDTAGFLRRTFGFLTDPVAISFMIGYGIVFAIVFGLAQYGLNNKDNGFGKGALLIGMIGAPLLGILFGLPMLSSALALLESVANRQKKVVDWPGFNIFDNFGDLMAIAASLLGAMLPGFLVGLWLGGDSDGAGRIQIAGMMLTTFLLFPVFMLSILDNGSLFQPISTSVVSSFGKAAEAWAGYFFKTMLAFGLTVLLWLLLLGDGKSPILAAMAGFLVAPLVFFTFQQLGSLAEAIAEHLSFEFTAPQENEEVDAD
jgi:DNA-directed RNA polymerase subunit RPC12/RpoP